MSAASLASPAPDLGAIKVRQQATWASGDYGQIGVRLQVVGESLCEAVDLHATDKVLDVASGNGNASLAAARHFGRMPVEERPLASFRMPEVIPFAAFLEGRRKEPS